MLPSSNVDSDSVADDVRGQKPLRGGEAWAIDFSITTTRRKMTRKEREAIVSSKVREQQFMLQQSQNASLPQGVKGDGGASVRVGETADSEDNRHMQVVSVDGMADPRSFIPTNLTTTREDLEQRFCLRIPRLLAVTKQYPKSCGVSSLTSVWNYLYTRIGEAAIGAARPPISQEEIMSILGFAPPFDEISWGPFTGNSTLFRWFHAINRHFGVKGRAYMLYKPQGTNRTTCTAAEALRELKRVLRDPHAGVIYHCHNHYMVPVGYQEIPLAQMDFYMKDVPETHTETTIFIGEVSRGRHDAMYARKWCDIVKDLMCCSPQFYNIRHPEMGIQTRVPKKKKEKTTNDGETAGQDGEKKDEKEEVREQEESTLNISAPSQEFSLSDRPTSINNLRRKTNGGNLHCLMCFRSDQYEEHMERYENVFSAGSSGDENESDGGSL